MSTVESILDLLNKWPKWKRITETPDRVDALTARIAVLEGKLQRAPGDACPKCGALEYRVASSTPHPHMGDMGVINRLMRCGECTYEETKTVTPGRQ
jgi:hypothetical protein